ncbi:MAG TPA: glycoside hydrolase family 3 N-terminal domain-containing protein [Thermoanaerobaculia bacterium]|nr:glycoside hydrolase family 3 N-terminal domain-containing protein [Thermoanaerobaculia bacterium]
MGRGILGVGITSTELTDLERSILRDLTPYAVVLFGRNIDTAAQLQDLIGEIRSSSSTPPLLMIDEEGGRVDRLRHILPGLPSAEAFREGERSEELVEEFGGVIGRLLRHFEIEVNLAPVVDIGHLPETPGLERRCFGDTAELVSNLGGRFIRAHQHAGSAVCLKHFPGMGYGTGDPHYGASVIDIPVEQIVTEELMPYVRLGEEAEAIMIGHASYPQIDGPNLPASLSYKIATELLRDVVGFSGVAISDDMEMHAVADLGSFEETAERALLAGNDVVLFCSHIERIPALTEFLEKKAAVDDRFSGRVREAEARAVRFRRHAERLVKAAAPVELARIAADAEKLYERLQDARFKDQPPLVPAVDRRQYSRTPGTGKTGREEWT